MRVLVVASSFPLHPDDGGPRSALDLCAALQRHVDVTALAPSQPGALARERWGELEVRRFSYFRLRAQQRIAYGAGLRETLSGSACAQLQIPWFVAAEARAVRALARERGCELVHSLGLVPQGLAVAWARGRDRRFAHVATLHGSDAYFLPRVPAARRIARWIRARVDAVLAPAEPVRECFDRVLGAPSHARVVHPGVDTALYRKAVSPRAESPFPGGFVLFAGRLVAQKGLDVLLRALPRVRERHPELGLVVLGDGPLADPLRSLARELGLEPWVRFAGAVDRAQVAAHLQACRVACAPSIVDLRGQSEAAPPLLLEALAAGARLVATDAGGAPELVVPGRSGWLALAGDPADLAAQLLLALDAPPPPCVAETADAHDWTRVAQQHLEVYEDALRLGGLRPSA
jgi:glycosyltransferase involved in cell wall biosynthesis